MLNPLWVYTGSWISQSSHFYSLFCFIIFIEFSHLAVAKCDVIIFQINSMLFPLKLGLDLTKFRANRFLYGSALKLVSQ